MARRGFFAELQRLSRVAAKERERGEREAIRNQVAAVRHAEQTKKAALHAKIQLAKATDAERKRLEKVSRDARVAAMEAEVTERNGLLAQTYEEVDSLLASTLGVDDYLDLNSLRVVPHHPTFDRADLEVPIPPPKRIADPVEPALALPAPPSGLASFFGKKKYAEAVDNARRTHEEALTEWRVACREVRTRRQAAEEACSREEARRLELLRSEHERYTKDCDQRLRCT